jgi:hypothetical protein
MFDEYGEPGKVFFAFKAFHQLLQTPNRVTVTGVPGGDGVTACCGMADDGQSAGLLLSNYRGQPAELTIDLKGLPLDAKAFKGRVNGEVITVDAEMSKDGSL